MRFLSASIIFVSLLSTVVSALPLVKIADGRILRLAARDDNELLVARNPPAKALLHSAVRLLGTHIRASSSHRPTVGHVGQRPLSHSHFSTKSSGSSGSHQAGTPSHPQAHQPTHPHEPAHQLAHPQGHEAARPQAHQPAHPQAHEPAHPQAHQPAHPQAHEPAHPKSHEPTSSSPGGHLAPEKHALIKEAQERGHKISPEHVVNIWKTKHPIPDVKSDILFLEKGNKRSGLAHIVDKHMKELTQKGVKEGDIPHLIEKATTTAPPVGMQKSRPIFKTEHNGQEMHVATSVGSNGYIVGMNVATDPAKKEKKSGQKKEVS